MRRAVFSGKHSISILADKENGNDELTRTCFVSLKLLLDSQRKGLEKRFQIQKYISKPDRKKLAERLGLKDSQVSITIDFTLQFDLINVFESKTNYWE